MIHIDTAVAALFSNTRTLKFKTQETVSFFTAANIIVNVSERTTDALPKWLKGHVCGLVAMHGFRSILPEFLFSVANVCRHNYMT